MKHKKVQILKFGTSWCCSVKFISETLRDRGNSSTTESFQHNQLTKKKNMSKLDEKQKFCIPSKYGDITRV